MKKFLSLFQLIAFFICSFAFAETVIKFYKKPNATNIKYVQVYLNGYPVEMIFDTGASTISVTKEVYASLGINKIIGRTISNTAGGYVHGDAFIIPSVKIGRIEVKNIRATYNDVITVNLLGGEFLKNFHYFVDEKNQTITFLTDDELLDGKDSGLSGADIMLDNARKNSSFRFKVNEK